MNIKTFFLERTNKVQQILRRYTSSGGECPHLQNGGYHNALAVLDPVDVPEVGDDDYHPLETITSCGTDGKVGGVIDMDDPRWPRKCICGYTFDDSVDKQYWPQRLYRRIDTGELMTLRDAPVGAMWHTHNEGMLGPDGESLIVRIPKNHNWMIDARASNCDSPCKWCGVPYHSHKKETCSNPGNPQYSWTVGSYEDSRPDHRCWVRHGDVRQQVHVDKNGNTCGAGGGSIISPDGWHGFLHNGHLTQC